MLQTPASASESFRRRHVCYRVIGVTPIAPRCRGTALLMRPMHERPLATPWQVILILSSAARLQAPAAPLSASVPPPSYPCLLIHGCCTRAAVVCCCTVPRVLPLKAAAPALLQSAAAPMPERVLCCGLLLRYQMHGLIHTSVATISVGDSGERGRVSGPEAKARHIHTSVATISAVRGEQPSNARLSAPVLQPFQLGDNRERGQERIILYRIITYSTQYMLLEQTA